MIANTNTRTPIPADQMREGAPEQLRVGEQLPVETSTDAGRRETGTLQKGVDNGWNRS